MNTLQKKPARSEGSVLFVASSRQRAIFGEPMKVGFVNVLAGLTVAAIAALSVTSAAHAQQEENLRVTSQNPIGDLISVPLQNNFNFDVGHSDNTGYVLNIQPVYPIHLNPDWNLITRPILPVISEPPFFSGPKLHALEELFGHDIGETKNGLGDLTLETAFSPRKPTLLTPGLSMIWGLGPALQFPTETSDELGTGKYSAGPTFVVFFNAKPFHVTTGFLLVNVWSYAGDEDRANVNFMELQPFFFYNLPKGWYLGTVPLITANWEADSNNRWTVPIGGGIGRVFKIGNQPINAQLTAYRNVVTPDDSGADWQLRFQWTFLFPEH